MVKKDTANMKVSVIIPTYNGAHKITTVLKALEQQTYHDFETIVVVDGSTDNTLDLLKDFKPGLKEFSYLYQENKGRAGVRNTGAKAATGDLMIFFDDDMRPEPDCVEKHVEHHQQLAGTIAVGRAQEDKRLCQTDFHFYRAHLSEKWTQPLLLQQGPIPESIVYLTAQNFSIPKSIFFELGGFDEQLRDTEDYELALRAKRAHIPIYYLHDALSWHDDFFSMQRYIKRQQEYKLYNKKVAELNVHYPQVTLRKRGHFKTMLLPIFKHPMWVQAIDKTVLLKVLPKSLRFKLYDIIVFAHLND